MKEPISSRAQRVPSGVIISRSQSSQPVRLALSSKLSIWALQSAEAQRGAIAARDAEEAARQAVSRVTQNRRAPDGSEWLYQLHRWMFFLSKMYWYSGTDWIRLVR